MLYFPLNFWANQIRLVMVRRGGIDDDIICSLTQKPIDSFSDCKLFRIPREARELLPFYYKARGSQ